MPQETCYNNARRPRETFGRSRVSKSPAFVTRFLSASKRGIRPSTAQTLWWWRRLLAYTYNANVVVCLSAASDAISAGTNAALGLTLHLPSHASSRSRRRLRIPYFSLFHAPEIKAKTKDTAHGSTTSVLRFVRTQEAREFDEEGEENILFLNLTLKCSRRSRKKKTKKGHD